MQLDVRSFITSVSVIPLCIGMHNIQLIMKEFGWSGRTVTAKVGVPKIDDATISCTRGVRRGTVIVSMLSAEAPTTGLPEGALFNPMTRFILTTPQAVQELDFCSPTSFTEYNAGFQIVFSPFHGRWALCGKNTWNPIITGWKKEGRRGRGGE